MRDEDKGFCLECRNRISERIRAGLARAKASGKRLGRPPKDIDIGRVAQLRGQEWGWRRIGKALGVSYQTIRNHALKNGLSNAPREENDRNGGLGVC